jgi:hypothetical protein
VVWTSEGGLGAWRLDHAVSTHLVSLDVLYAVAGPMIRSGLRDGVWKLTTLEGSGVRREMDDGSGRLEMVAAERLPNAERLLAIRVLWRLKRDTCWRVHVHAVHGTLKAIYGWLLLRPGDDGVCFMR